MKKLEDAPRVFTFPLVDLLVQDVKMTPAKARRVIERGQVTVDDAVVKDPDLRVDGTARVMYYPQRSRIKRNP